MQGTIIKVAVSDGDTVSAGDLVVVLEAMKMENPVTAHKDGTITGLSANAGSSVSQGTVHLRDQGLTADPVEINAGSWYLRPLRADDRIDDRPAVVASCADPEICRWRSRPDPDLVEAMAYIRQRAGEWERDERCTWAVCEPTTGEMLGEVELTSLDLDHGTAEAACWALPRARGRGMTTTALSAVLRFGFGGLGLQCVGLRLGRGQRRVRACGGEVRVPAGGAQARGHGGRRAAGGRARGVPIGDGPLTFVHAAF